MSLTRTPTLTRIRLATLALSVLLALAAAPPAQAVNPDEMLDDPVLEARARKLSKGLRCLVCRNQNIDDSNAALARDFRILLRERLAAGDSDQEAVAWLVDRYGAYVLLEPPLSATTAMLWIGPALFVLVAAGGFWLALRPRRRTAPDDPAAASQVPELTAEDRALISRILNESKEVSP